MQKSCASVAARMRSCYRLSQLCMGVDEEAHTYTFRRMHIFMLVFVAIGVGVSAYL